MKRKFLRLIKEIKRIKIPTFVKTRNKLFIAIIFMTVCALFLFAFALGLETLWQKIKK